MAVRFQLEARGTVYQAGWRTELGAIRVMVVDSHSVIAIDETNVGIGDLTDPEARHQLANALRAYAELVERKPPDLTREDVAGDPVRCDTCGSTYTLPRCPVCQGGDAS